MSMQHSLPIVLAFDRTLVVTNTVAEELAAAFSKNPLRPARAAAQSCFNGVPFHAALAKEMDIAALVLPLREDLLTWLRAQAASGREIHLCSNAPHMVCAAVAQRLGMISSVIVAPDVHHDGAAKARHLKQRFPGGFVFAGGHKSDIPVWQAANAIVLVGASAALTYTARKLGKPVEAEFTSPALSTRDWLKALRIHHWSKNALIFVPLILGHAWNEPIALVSTALGFICLVLTTSATYLLNDIADLESDRNHVSKRTRALASGRLSIATGLAIAAACLLVAFAGAAVLSPPFAQALGTYLILTLAYSLGLKRFALLDTLIIAVLFTTRLVMGIVLLDHPFSEWLLAFSMFFFFSLALAKRHTEIVRAQGSGSRALSARGYDVQDEPLTLALGVACSVASLLIMVLFMVEEVFRRTVYANPKVLWGVPIILSIWIGRIWLLAHRGQMTDDPVSFALRDKASLLLGAATALFFLIAL
ncbi:MAG: UbiA family prenyltransferase [Xanthobacteraceae bacterium]